MTNHLLSDVFVWLVIVLCCMGTLYAVIAAVAMPFFNSSRSSGRGFASSRGVALSVTVLKPLCGIEPRLYENLATFCEQAHPCSVGVRRGISGRSGDCSRAASAER